MSFEFELEIQVSAYGDINSQVNEVVYEKHSEIKGHMNIGMVLSALFDLKAC